MSSAVESIAAKSARAEPAVGFFREEFFRVLKRGGQNGSRYLAGRAR